MGYFVGVPASPEMATLVESLRGNVPGCHQDNQLGLRDHVHVTLAHLGKQTPDTEHFAEIAHGRMPFEASFEGASIFRNAKTTHLVLPVTLGSDSLRMLHAQLKKSGKNAGHVFVPHMTVSTIYSDAKGESESYPSMVEFRDRCQKHEWGRMIVSSFCLYSSRRGDCRVVDRWSLTGRGEGVL